MKNCRIHKMPKKFVLIVNPKPIMEGELLMFQPIKTDQQEKDLILYRDYSLRKRLPTKPRPKKLSSHQTKKMEQEDEATTRLRGLEIDTKTLLSTCDWNNLTEVL